MKTLTTLAVVGLIFLNFTTTTLAQDSAYGVSFEEVNPVDRGEYAVKRVSEKIKLFFLGVRPQAKASFYFKLSKRRFSELLYVVESKDENQIEKAANRYFTTVGQMTEYVEGKNWEIKSDIKSSLQKQIEIFPKLIEKYPADSAGWIFLRQDLDYARLYKDRL